MKVLEQAATLVAVMMLSGTRLDAQQPADSAAQRLQQRLDSLTAAIRDLQARMDTLTRDPRTSERSSPVSQPRASGTYMNVGFVSLADVGWSSERNVGSLQLGDHDPKVRGFTMPNTELTLEGAVDPFFKGFSSLVYKIDDTGASAVELEEAYFLTSALPGNLQVKGGQFFAEFGRQNAQHPHSWAFVDQPLILNRMFGPDGFRGQGARVSWLAPTPWYTEAMVSVLNSGGPTMFSFRTSESSEIHGGTPIVRDVRRGTDLVISPRVTTSFDLTSTQALVLGASAAFGPNSSGADASTQVYGADLYWKWKPEAAQKGFPFLSLQAEALARRYGAAERRAVADSLQILPAATLADRGAYAQVLWGIRPRVVAGLRGDWANGDAATFASPLRAERTRISPNLTWYPSEFSKLRLQYNYDDRRDIGRDHSVWLQFEFLLGAHAAHKF